MKLRCQQQCYRKVRKFKNKIIEDSQIWRSIKIVITKNKETIKADGSGGKTNKPANCHVTGRVSIITNKSGTSEKMKIEER